MTSRATNDSRGTPEGSSSLGFTGRFRGRFSGGAPLVRREAIEGVRFLLPSLSLSREALGPFREAFRLHPSLRGLVP